MEKKDSSFSSPLSVRNRNSSGHTSLSHRRVVHPPSPSESGTVIISHRPRMYRCSHRRTLTGACTCVSSTARPMAVVVAAHCLPCSSRLRVQEHPSCVCLGPISSLPSGAARPPLLIPRRRRNVTHRCLARLTSRCVPCFLLPRFNSLLGGLMAADGRHFVRPTKPDRVSAGASHHRVGWEYPASQPQ